MTRPAAQPASYSGVPAPVSALQREHNALERLYNLRGQTDYARAQLASARPNSSREELRVILSNLERSYDRAVRDFEAARAQRATISSTEPRWLHRCDPEPAWWRCAGSARGGDGDHGRASGTAPNDRAANAGRAMAARRADDRRDGVRGGTSPSESARHGGRVAAANKPANRRHHGEGNSQPQGHAIRGTAGPLRWAHASHSRLPTPDSVLHSHHQEVGPAFP